MFWCSIKEGLQLSEKAVKILLSFSTANLCEAICFHILQPEHLATDQMLKQLGKMQLSFLKPAIKEICKKRKTMPVFSLNIYK